MLVYCPTSHEAHINLALEEALFNAQANDFNEDLLMLWQNEPSIIIGRHQNIFEEVNIELVQAKKIALIRRITGGGAVYHDLGNLNFSFIQKRHATNHGFNYFISPIIEALKSLGLNASLSGRNDICIEDFRNSSKADLVKVSGNAQFKSSQNILHHGTILVKTDLNMLSECLKPDPEKYQSKALSSVRSRVANLCDFLPNLTIADLCKAIISQCQAKTISTLPITILSQAQELAQTKYASADWNYNKAPKFTVHDKKRFHFGTLEYFFLIEKGQIKEASFQGDFFAQSSELDLSTILSNIAYKPQAIRQALAILPKVLIGINSEEDIEEVFNFLASGIN